MFKDIKAGEKVSMIERCGISLWKTMYFKKSFVIHVEVERTTKTQFVAGGMRFKKETGFEICSGFGRNVARKTTGTMNDYTGTYDLSVDQSSEFSEYSKKLSAAKLLIERENDYFNMYNCKTLDDIATASELLKKLKALAPCNNSTR